MNNSFDLLNFNATLLVHIATKLWSNVFCDMYLSVDVRFK